jgi:hypothetical protein
MKFDLDAIDTKTLADEGVFMAVKKVGSDEPLMARNGQPVRLRILGPDSDRYREISRRQIQKRLRRYEGGKAQEIDLDEAERDTLDILVACTVGWENVFTPEGNEIPYSEAAARALYTNYPVLREQVDAFATSRANFMKASSGS